MLDFTHLEQYRENNRIEAKKALGGLPRSIWETYSAFANTLGGVILLGVEEYKDRTLHPVNLPDPERLVSEFWDKINNPAITNINILTPKNIQIRNINGNHIIVITVPRARRQDRPVYINRNAFHGSYRRNGEGDYRCTRDEVLSMQRDARIQTPDMQILSEVNADVFDSSTIRLYRNHLKAYQPGHAWEGLTDPEFLCQLGAAEIDQKGLKHPTVAGLLMFGQESAILREFPDFSLLYQSETVRISSTDSNFSGNLCDFYFRVCDQIAKQLFIRNKQPKEVPGTAPLIHEALREALANCLVNADYYGSCSITVINRAEQFIFTNPGAFRVDVETAKIGGISDPRNAALVKMFNLLNIGDCSGDGLSRIYSVWQQMDWELPTITEHFAPDYIELTLTMGKSGADKAGAHKPEVHNAANQSGRQLVINYLTTHANATEQELTAFIGMEMSDAKKLFDCLIEDGIIEIKTDAPHITYRLRA